jgi:uncharacterized protein
MEKATLRVHVNPRSSRNQITGWEDGVLSVKLTAPPVEGAANKACVELVADQLHVRKSQITLISGEKSREKVLAIAGMSQSHLQKRVDELLTPHQ